MNNHVNTLNGLHIGDEVLCKKHSTKDSYRMFQVNEIYTVTLLDIDDMSAWITYGADLNNDGRWFAIVDDENLNINNFISFHEHFYSQKEIRKFKLEKLKCSML